MKKISNTSYKPTTSKYLKQTQNKDGMNDGIILAIFKNKDDLWAGPRKLQISIDPSMFFFATFDKDKLWKNPLTPMKRVPLN